jgi:hypothetical protein
MKRILLAAILMMTGTPTMADEPAIDCATLLQRIDAKLKIVRIRKHAYDEIVALKDEARTAMAANGDCTTPLRKALRMLGG